MNYITTEECIHYLTPEIIDPQEHKKCIAFLDRDGVINYDHGYVGNWKNFDFLPGVIDALKILQQHYRLVICTNQSGISQGFYDVDSFVSLMSKVQQHLENNGIHLSRIYFCPHPSRATSVKVGNLCYCRKPQPGMLKHGLLSYDAIRERCIMIGDKKTDIEAGWRAGIKRNYLISSHDLNCNYTDMFDSLFDLAKTIDHPGDTLL